MFAFVAFGLIFEAVGYYAYNWLFWTLFITAYLFLMVVFVIEIYFNGDFRTIMAHLWKNIIGEKVKCKMYISSIRNINKILF